MPPPWFLNPIVLEGRLSLCISLISPEKFFRGKQFNVWQLWVFIFFLFNQSLYIYLKTGNHISPPQQQPRIYKHVPHQFGGQPFCFWTWLDAHSYLAGNPSGHSPGVTPRALFPDTQDLISGHTPPPSLSSLPWVIAKIPCSDFPFSANCSCCLLSTFLSVSKII